jgi:hypothetical protein
MNYFDKNFTFFLLKNTGVHDRIAGGFTTTYAIGAITTDVVRCEKVCQ